MCTGNLWRMLPRLWGWWGKNCVFLPAVGKQNATFSPDFTQPGKSLKEIPCRNILISFVFSPSFGSRVRMRLSKYRFPGSGFFHYPIFSSLSQQFPRTSTVCCCCAVGHNGDCLRYIGHESKDLSVDHLLRQSANAELQLFQPTARRNYLICGGFFIADWNTSWIA